ncbi:S8 family serine peptidase [Streptomyces collinus]|uniref:S8 family serine peptidase n=1 Tax=Streptomyces collinus TaxID=42684 RepID=UPI003828A8D1
MFLKSGGRRLSAVFSVMGAAAVLSAGTAPGAAAADAQPQQWYLDAMKAQDIWKISTGKGVKVAVIDTGVNPATSSLKGQVLADEVPKAVAYHATQDYEGHGTSMAEVIAGTGTGGGIKGLAPGAKIVPYRIKLTGLKDKQEQKKTPEPADAIRAAADSDAKVINMSFGGPYWDPDTEAAVKYAASKGKLLFASIGNSADKGNKAEYPASLPFVVGVAASDKSGTVGKFSTHGNYVDFAAPGLDIPAWCDNTFTKYCTSEGTSPASAIASASAALVWSAHPHWTGNQVLRALIDTASRSWPKSKPSVYLGYGLLRPRKVLEDPKFNPGPAGADPLATQNVAADDTPAATPSNHPTKSSGSSSGPTSAAAQDSGSGGTETWVIIGSVAAVLIIGGAGFAVLRARRNA